MSRHHQTTQADSTTVLPEGFKVVCFRRDGWKVRETLDYMHDYTNWGHEFIAFNPATREEKHYVVSYGNAQTWMSEEDAAAREVYAEWVGERSQWVKWFGEILHRVRTASEIKEGATVEVFKGRKVPKGEYTVTRIGEGQFGPYCDLMDSVGQRYRFVSLDNCRVRDLEQKRREIVLASFPEGKDELWTMVFAGGHAGHPKPGTLAVWCDLVEDERGGLPSTVGIHIRNWYCDGTFGGIV